MKKPKLSIERVRRALADMGLDIEVQELPDSTRTAEEAAAAVGCRVGQICKSLVFKDAQADEAVMIITSGDNRVNMKKAEVETGRKLSKADADFVRDKTGFAIGGVAPVGFIGHPVIFIDRDLLAYDRIWAAAGTPKSVFAMTPDQLLAMTGGQVIAPA